MGHHNSTTTALVRVATSANVKVGPHSRVSEDEPVISELVSAELPVRLGHPGSHHGGQLSAMLALGCQLEVTVERATHSPLRAIGRQMDSSTCTSLPAPRVKPRCASVQINEERHRARSTSKAPRDG